VVVLPGQQHVEVWDLPPFSRAAQIRNQR